MACDNSLWYRAWLREFLPRLRDRAAPRKISAKLVRALKRRVASWRQFFAVCSLYLDGSVEEVALCLVREGFATSVPVSVGATSATLAVVTKSGNVFDVDSAAGEVRVRVEGYLGGGHEPGQIRLAYLTLFSHPCCLAIRKPASLFECGRGTNAVRWVPSKSGSPVQAHSCTSSEPMETLRFDFFICRWLWCEFGALRPASNGFLSSQAKPGRAVTLCAGNATMFTLMPLSSFRPAGVGRRKSFRPASPFTRIQRKRAPLR